MTARTPGAGCVDSLGARLDDALEQVRAGRARPDRLIPLYERAAREAAGEVQRGFFLTHAYVHALETGDARAEALRAELCAMGRER